MKRRIVQLVLVGAISVAASTQARANIPYLGGRVIPSVRIIPIFYGYSWTTSPTALAQQAATRTYLTELADYIRGAKNPAGKEPLYAQYGVTNAQVNEMPCFSCVDMGPRVLTNTEVKGIIESYQQQNNITWAADKLFLLMPGPGFSTTSGDCGFAGNEGDTGYFAVVASACSTFQKTISRHVFKSVTNPNHNLVQGWPEVFAPCLGSTVDFGAGEIQLPWNNRAGACPATGPNIAFNDKSLEVLQVLATSAGTGRLFHALRYPNGAWTSWGDVNSVIGSTPATFEGVDAQATLGVFNHVIVREWHGSSRLYHTIRHDTGWTQFVDVNTATGSDSLHFYGVSLADVNGDLHVCTHGPAGVLHAIRSQNGTWSNFGNVLAHTGSPPSWAVDVDCAGIGADMHIVMVTENGGLFHSIRFGDSATWQDLGNAGAVAGLPVAAETVSVAVFGGDLHVTVGADNQQFHAIRHSAGAGSWTPFAAVPSSADADVASTGTQDFVHLVSLDSATLTLNHRTWDPIAGWGGINATGSPPPPPLVRPEVEPTFWGVTATSSLGF